mgnify:CR=1 FL=1
MRHDSRAPRRAAIATYPLSIAPKLSDNLTTWEAPNPPPRALPHPEVRVGQRHFADLSESEQWRAEVILAGDVCYESAMAAAIAAASAGSPPSWPVIERVMSRPVRDAAFAHAVRHAYGATWAMTGLRIINGGDLRI